MTKYVTSSLLSSFRDCPRKCFYSYHEKRVPVSEASALSFGKSWHTAIEAYCNAVKAGSDGKVAAAAALLAMAGQIPPDVAATLSAMLEYYSPPRSERFEIIDVEKEFETTIDSPDEGKRSFYGYRLKGKIDVVLKHIATNTTWIEDHKTTSSEIHGFGNYWAGLQIDAQMQNYCGAFNARGFVYDVVRKPGIKMCDKDAKAAATLGVSQEDAFRMRCEEVIAAEPTSYYQYREHTKTDDDLRQGRIDLWQQVEMYRACDSVGRWPRNCNACNGKFGTCAYIGVCTGSARLDDDAAFRTKASTNEELSK